VGGVFNAIGAGDVAGCGGGDGGGNGDLGDAGGDGGREGVRGWGQVTDRTGVVGGSGREDERLGSWIGEGSVSNDDLNGVCHG
jgi:hypothetical protein